MKKKFNVVVVGAGGTGNTHTNAWVEHGQNVVAVVDVNEESAKKTCEKFNIPKYYTDYKEALKNPEVDVVSVCTPLKYHAPVTIFAAEQGKHVFCEKPMCRSREEAEAMEKAIKDAGVSFGIGFQRSRSDDVYIMRDLFKQEKFGSPCVIDVTYRTKYRKRKDGTVKSFMHDAEGNMGVAMDRACHDYIMWENILESRVKKVFAKGRILQKNNPELASIKKLAWDTIFAVMEYENGMLMNFSMSWGMEQNTTMKGEWQHIIGPKGGAQLFPRKKIILEQDGSKETINIEEPMELHMYQFIPFIESLKKGEPAPVGLKDGKDPLAVSLAIFKSLETGKEVEVEYF